MDFRIMLEEMNRDIDAVVIATSIIPMRWLHWLPCNWVNMFYVQKPLTHSVYESRVLLEASRKYKVVTQMGNEGHSSHSVADVLRTDLGVGPSVR